MKFFLYPSSCSSYTYRARGGISISAICGIKVWDHEEISKMIILANVLPINLARGGVGVK